MSRCRRVTFQIVNPKEIAGRTVTGRSVPVVIYSSTGKSLFEATRKVTFKGSRRINLQHLRVLVIGESLAREGVKEVFDLLERDHTSRLTTRVYIAKGSDSEKVLKTLTLIDEIPANAILGKIKLSEMVLGENYEVDHTDTIHGIYRKIEGTLSASSGFWEMLKTVKIAVICSRLIRWPRATICLLNS